jgi:hypothetical protein
VRCRCLLLTQSGHCHRSCPSSAQQIDDRDI